jgi:hypothetical protein
VAAQLAAPQKRLSAMSKEVKLSLQKKPLTVLDAYDKTKVFVKKLLLWIRYVKYRQFAPFPILESFLVENDIFADSEFLERVNCEAEI